MGDYLKLFNTHSEYESYITGSDKILPNVSYCENNNEVHYNPWTDPRVIAKFNVEDVSEPVMLYGANDGGVIGTELFSKIEIDGEAVSISDLDDNQGEYTFKTTGEHTVKYTLLDPTSIGNFAFYFCSNLTSITIPSSVTSIGNYAFSECSGLTSISVESGNTVYDSRNNCNAIIETATNTLLYGCQNTIIPSSVTSIGDGAFNNCDGLTSINIPSSVTSIGESAFFGCRGLTSITIPNSVTSIGDSAFGECSSLTSITIPSSVTSIGNAAFENCSGLTSITSSRTTAPTIQTTTFKGVKTGGTLYVPAGSNYSTWMGTGDYYLGKYNWTKVEQ